MSIRTGDTVLHRPSGEKWMVAYVEGDFLAWRGWPDGEARLSDCDLVEACTDATHWKWVTHIAESASGWRALKCQAMLQERYAAFIEPDIADQRRPCPHCGAPMVASVPARDAEPTPEMKARDTASERMFA